ncbi:MAG TPA: alpha/beta hydrolase, partial [Mycobacterium sp.]|nr:alpha/beta hydrolase [Mycobacterium sp.]
WGQPAGKPVLEFRGLPSSRSGDAIDLDVLGRAQVRRITVDRPGVGFSDPQPGRTLLDWPADVRELADALGLDAFAVVGTSGGGPYAAACGYALPERVSRVVLVSGLGPLDRPGALDGMNRGEATTMILARRVPVLAHWLVGAAVTAERIRPGMVYQGLVRALPPADQRVAAQRRVRESLVDSYALAFRQGVRGQVQDWGIIASPWGFRPEDIDVPVQLYHGVLDDRVPLHHADDLARRVPHSNLTEYPDEGHMLVFSHAEAILIAAAE